MPTRPSSSIEECWLSLWKKTSPSPEIPAPSVIRETFFAGAYIGLGLLSTEELEAKWQSYASSVLIPGLPESLHPCIDVLRRTFYEGVGTVLELSFQNVPFEDLRRELEDFKQACEESAPSSALSGNPQ